MIKTHYISIIIMSFLTIYGKAQQDLTLTNLDYIQQVQYVNPAFRPLAKINIGFPSISSIYINHNNTIFTPKDFFETSGNTTSIRIEHLKKMWKKRNDLSLSLKYDILNFGFAVKKNYFSLNITENLYTRITLPKDFLLFPLTGNASSELENNTLDFSNLALELNHYREYAFGFQRNLNDRINIGGKLKYLYGMENIHTKKTNLTWKTDPETFDWTINGSFALNTSGVASLTDTINNNHELENKKYIDYATKKKNRGLGIDIGGTFKLTDKIDLFASVLDLGFISWKSDNKNLVLDDGKFVFSGIDMTNVIFSPDSVQQDSIDAAYKRIENEARDAFSASENKNSYRSSLISKFYIGGTYKLYETQKLSGKIGALAYGELLQGRIKPAITLSYTQNLGKILQATASYSMSRRSYNNLGLGASLNIGFFQLYLVADNIMAGRMASFTRIGQKPISYPYDAKNINFRAGVNLTFGRKNKDKDDDGIKDKKDKCPEVAGLIEFGGCPDTDGDSIPDNEDLCPRRAGVKKFKGCPDTDGDGVKDSEDECPNQKGTSENKGCPDTDGDGIIDKNDLCPNVKGIVAFKGCPDTDGDGIEDSKDDCPEKAGTKEFNGCPDTDGDGIPDNKDACPLEVGEKENNGCPWGDIDNDGVKDNEDKCPSIPGTIKNKGCPEIKKEEQEILNTAFDNLEFESARAVIKDESYPSLQALAELLIKKSEWKLKISGHTDSDGNAESNLKLSKDRAQAVANYLTSKGIKKERLKVEGFGETKPISDNNTKEGKQKNRRVEMKIEFE